jgi:hypothetical protein
MGAGNYYFRAPAGDSWSKMVYVDLQPIYWTDEQERRKKEFDEFLKGDREAGNVLLDAGDADGRSEAIEGLREKWRDDNYPGASDEREFYEDPGTQQKEDILSALQAAFPGSEFELDGRHADEIADAMIVGEVGRMVVASAYTYYGTDLALIVTPRRELQDVIWSIENGGFEFERGWPSWQRDALRAENARLAGIKRSVESGALHREMQTVFERMVQALHEGGLANTMWFRGCAWTGYRYTGTDLCKSIDSRLAKRTRTGHRRQKKLVQDQAAFHQGA